MLILVTYTVIRTEANSSSYPVWLGRMGCAMLKFEQQ